MEDRTTTAHPSAGAPLSGEVVSMRQGTWSLLWIVYRRHPRAAGIAMMALALVIAGGVVSAVQYFRADRAARETAEAQLRAESSEGIMRRALAAADVAAARQLVHQGRPAGALPHLARAVRLAPDNSPAAADLLLLLAQTPLLREAAPGSGTPQSALLSPAMAEQESGPGTSITTLDFSGPFLFSAEQAGTCRRWHVPTLEEVHPAKPFPFRPLAIRALDEATATVALADGSCHRWTAGSDPTEAVPPQRPPFGLWETAALSPQGMEAAFARAPRAYDPSEPASGYLITNLAAGISTATGTSLPSRALALNAQDALASGWWDGRIGLTPRGQGQRRELKHHRAAVTALTFSGDSSRLLSGDTHGTLVLWDLPGAQPVAELPAPVSAVAFSRNGSRFAAACGSRIYLFDAATRQGLGLPLEAEETVTAIALDREGGIVAAGLARGAIRLWHLPTANCKAPAWLADFAEAWSGGHLNNSSEIESRRDPVKPNTFRIAVDASRASHPAAAALYDWLMSPPSKRSLSPWAPWSLTEYLEMTSRRPGRAQRAEERPPTRKE